MELEKKILREIVHETYTSRLLNRKIPFTKYLNIAMENGFKKAFEALEEAREYKELNKVTYWSCKKKLHELREETYKRIRGLRGREKSLNDEESFFKVLFTDYIAMVVKKGEVVSGSEFMKKTGITEDQLLKFIDWMDEKGYYDILKLVVKARKSQAGNSAKV